MLGRTALFHAVSNNSRDSTRYLLGYGADPYIVPNNGAKIIS